MENNCFQITGACRPYHRSRNHLCFVLVVLLLGLCQSATTHAQNLVWAKSMSGPDYKYAQSAVDGQGNVYAVGFFNGTIDLDPGPSTVELTSTATTAEGYNIFVSKLDADGNLVWAKRIGGKGNTTSYAMAVDGLGNVYFTGGFEGTVDFDPGSAVVNMTSAGSDDIFVSKLTTDGEFLWAKRFGGSLMDYGGSVTVDGSGNLYTTGVFKRTADFDPGEGVFNLISAGDIDIFVSKLDIDGNFVWAKSFGGPGDDDSQSVALDGLGNVYTTGHFRGVANFDAGLSEFTLTSAGDDDIFVSKLSSTGEFVWAQRIGGAKGDKGYGVKVDNSGNVYTTGSFRGVVDFDPGAGTYELTAVGEVTKFNFTGDTDAFISKLNSDGEFVWAKNFGGANEDQSFGMMVDNSGNVYTTGVFSGAADSPPGSVNYEYVPLGKRNAFLNKHDTDGNLVWVVGFGGGFLTIGNSVFVDGSSTIYLTG